MKRIVAAVGLLVIAIWLLGRLAGFTTEPSESVKRNEPAPGSATEAKTAPHVPTVGESGLRRDRAAAERAPLIEATGAWLRVVLGTAQTPVPGADVELLPSSLLDVRYAARVESLSRTHSSAIAGELVAAELSASRALRGKTGSDGRFRLPRIAESVRLEVRSGRWRRIVLLVPREQALSGARPGTLAIDRNDESCEIVLELFPALDVDVRVVGRDGRALAGVDVMLTANTPRNGRMTVVSNTSDADGRTRFPYVETFLDRFGLLPDHVEPAVEADLFGGENPSAALGAAGSADREVVLRMPECGLVRLVTPELGLPLRRSAVVELHLLEGRESTPRWRRNAATHRRQRTQSRVVTFRVATGRRLFAAGSVDGIALCEGSFVGPRSDRETVSYELRVEPKACYLHGQFVDAAGEPIHMRAGTIAVLADDAPCLRRFATTSTAGRFLVVVPNVPEAAERFRLELATRAREDRAPELGVVELSREMLQPGGHDVGVVRGHAMPVLVRGSVVDDAGKPPPASELELGVRVAYDAGDGKRRYRGLPYASVQLGDDGRFTAYGAGGPRRLFLRVWGKHYLAPEHVEFERGCEDLNLVVRRACMLRGRVLLPELPCSLFQVVAIPEASSDESVAARIERDGGFVVKRLASGPYRIELRVRASQEVLRAVRGVVAKPGEVAADPRVDPVDLRTALRPIDVRVHGPGGKPIANGLVIDETRRSGEPGSAWSVRDGRARIYTALPALDLAAVAVGCAPARKRRVTGDTTFELERGVSFAITLIGELPPGLDLLLHFAGQREHARWLDVIDATTGDARRRRFPLDPAERRAVGLSSKHRQTTAFFCEPGDYSMSVYLRREGGGFTWLGSERSIRVPRMQSRAHRFVLDQTELDEALARIRR